MMRGLPLAAAALLGALGCRSLPDIEANVCGNGVWEPEAGEACDTVPQRPGLVCRIPGVIGECQHDCTLGSDDTRPDCPAGFGCAGDSICRADTRTFEAASAPLTRDACSWLSAADFDGDGHIELLSAEPSDALKQARFRLHYFERDGRLQETRTFPRLTTRPVVRDVDGEGHDDLIFSNLRVGMVPGRSDREWVPSAFSSYVVPNPGLLMLGVSKDSVGIGTALVAVTAIDGEGRGPVPGLYVPDFTSRGLELQTELPGPVDQLSGTPIAADLIEGADSPCDEVVLAFRGDSRVHVYDLCVSSSDPTAPDLVWRGTAVPRVVELPEGVQVDSAPLAGDVDGDGHLDVVIGAGGLSFVAHGDGSNLEAMASPLSVLIEQQGPTDVVLHEVHMPTPLALGDLSGDGVADFVLPTGIASSYERRSLPGTRYVVSLGNRGAPWTMAQVSDLNGNGLADAVAATAGVPGLTFASGTGTSHQIEAELGTRGPVRFLTTGDFDGDGVGDLAFVEEAPDAKQVLALAFGARDTPPAHSRPIAELDVIDQLGDHSERGFEHLFVTANQRRRGREVSTLTLFDGNSDRLPFAPYTLVTFSQDGNLEDSAALAVIAGAFVGSSPGSTDVIALGLRQNGPAWDLWLLPRIGGKEPPAQLSGPPSGSFVPVHVTDSLVSLAVAGAAADLDADGYDEALWLMPDGSASCALLIHDIDSTRGTFVQAGIVRFDEPCPEPELAVSDLDGDGALDLVALLGDARRAPRELSVLWNDGQGRFSDEARSRIADPNDADITSFSVFPDLPPNEPGRRIAFVSGAGLRVAEPSAGPRNVSYELIRDVQSLERAQAVLVADPNGDRVPDIFAADARGLWLFRAALR